MIEEDLSFKDDDFLSADTDFKNADQITRPVIGFYKEAFIRLFHDPTALCCVWILIMISIGTIVFPMISQFGYAGQNLAFSNKPPMSIDPVNGLTHFFGTDRFGRDLFIRAWYGARISLTIAIAVAVIDCILGVTYGGISGYTGGKTDTVMMRILEVISGIPYLIIVLLLLAVLPRGMMTLIIAYSITGWTSLARLVRSEVIGLREKEFIIAAKIMGTKNSRIIRKHLVPNLLGIIIVNITLDIPNVIFTEAFLSLLGLGIAPPYPSWGVMANEGSAVFQSYPYQLAVPAAFICITMLAFNLLGDRLQDIFDPRQRRMFHVKSFRNRKSKNLI